MQICYGKSVLDGITIGKIMVYDHGKTIIKRRKVEDPEVEVSRFNEARLKACEEFSNLYEKALSGVGRSGASIFVIHQLLAEDIDYINSVEHIIRTHKVNAEYAVAKVSDNTSFVFTLFENFYMRERAADMRDVCERIISVLSGGIDSVLQTDEPVIVLTDDLAPSETIQLNREKVLSVVTVNGSTCSHTAILARTMGISALVETDIKLSSELDGKLAVVDAYHGCIYLEPTKEILEIMQKRQFHDEEQKRVLKQLKGKKTIARNNREILLYANINSIKDIDLAIENDAEGIGLFRSEFIFLDKTRFPTENEQYVIYKTLLSRMAPKPVTIRTIDVGADKTADYLHIPPEKNPAMGMRGVRYTLNKTNIFRIQLRALLRASAHGKLKILIPMIISESEVLKVLAIIRDVEEELFNKEIEVGDYEFGVMIETPAAVMISEVLANLVDFFSIGTNDLTQYTLAIDRQNPLIEQFYDPYHVAVKRMIQRTIINAKLGGIKVGICGELAGDIRAIPDFIKLGVDYLSIVPNKILQTKKFIVEN